MKGIEKTTYLLLKPKVYDYYIDVQILGVMYMYMQLGKRHCIQFTVMGGGGLIAHSYPTEVHKCP